MSALSRLDSPVPVLTYHSLDESGSVVSTAPGVFREQMRALADRGFTGIAAGQLVDAWEGNAMLPARPVVLTFDDGFANVLDHAAPVLAALKFSATVYVVSGLCGKTNDWPDQGAAIPRLPLLSWAALAELITGGFEMGAHSVTHQQLMRLSRSAVEREVLGSKEMIEQRLGQVVKTFAYPFGLVSPDAHAVARAGYRAAMGTVLGVARRTDDRHCMARVDMYYFRDPRMFRLFGTAAGRAYLSARALGRAVRARVVSSV
jgi:peptidoglycan/xylan/chitin deacetylase (PgdA/CDA1 family)